MLSTRIACVVDIAPVIVYKKAVIPDPIYARIGLLIKAKRKQLDYKQESMAKELGISRGALANIETGRQRILVHQLYQLASVLKLQPSDLLPINANNVPKVDSAALPLPPGLKAKQKEQVARFFSAESIHPPKLKENNHANTKR